MNLGQDISLKKRNIGREIFEIVNKSFSSQLDEDQTKFIYNGKPYLKKEEIPEIEIIDEKTMKYDKDKLFFKIKDYIQKINNTSDDLLDNYFIYNYCGIC